MSFNEVAANWDIPERVDRAKIISSGIINKIKPNDSMTALEIGCGTGLITFGVNDQFKKVFCIDTSQEMIKVLEEKISKNKIDNVYTYDAEKIFNDNFSEKFDVIYSSMVFHHILDIKDEINKLYKVMKKDGSLVIIDLDEEDGSFHKNDKNFVGHNGFNRKELGNILNNCGFNKVSFDTVFEGKRIICNNEIEYSLFLCVAKI